MRSSRLAAVILCSVIATGTPLAATGIANADTGPNTASWCTNTGYATTDVTPPGLDIATPLSNLLNTRCHGGFANL